MPRKKKNPPPVEAAVSTSAKPVEPSAAVPPAAVPIIAPEKTAPPKDVKGFPIVGIGASAGGLEALEGFFTAMPADSNLAFVVIQHLSPKYKSIMGELLQKHTAMRVFEIKDGISVAPNCIYLNPPDKHIMIINRMLQLIDSVKTQGVNLPIDAFFRSLSQDQGEKAICIILSGTGTDGTLGLKAIKGAGGLAMVQAEAEAKYAGMPSSAIETGVVDFILPVEKMPVELIKYAQHPYILEGSVTTGISGSQFHNAVQKVFALIRVATGHDFSNYKQTTIRRRIERRMAVHQIEKIEDYIRYLQKMPVEVETLFKEMLIGVTNFFRDPDAFEFLAGQVLPELIARKISDAPIRLWTTGCATGEEVYSLAIVLAETMTRLKTHVAVQIFASDLDPAAIDYARTAVYPESITADVSAERLQRFFVKGEQTYAVKKEIREMVVFAVQNMVKDPPFSRLDLVSCRNVLIYMDAVLQKQLLPMFHYTLLPQGVLFLGSSESIGEFTDLFMPLNTKLKIFRRREQGLAQIYERGSLPFTKHRLPPPGIGEKNPPASFNIQHLAEKIVLENYALPSVVVNKKHEILYFLGPTDRFLEPPTGEPSFNLVQMAREGLRYKLSSALQKAAKQQKPVIVEGLRVKQNGAFHTVDVIVRPLGEAVVPTGLLLVVFDEKPPAEKQVSQKPAGQPETEVDPRVASVEQELQSTREYLQTTIEELETSNEELKSTNEELQSVNEELQSANEELETSKEELQSTNEELVTVNSELQSKVEELSRASNDINNLLASTDIGTIFLDNDLRIKRFTPAMSKIFNLLPADIGRPISDLTSKITYDDLERDAKEVLDTLHRKELELQTREGVWYAARIIPYRTVDNIIDGVVLTFVDLTATAKHSATLAQVNRQL